MTEKVYIGDGVYVQFDGWHIWLSTVSAFDFEHRIALDPDVYRNLLTYVGSLRPQEEAQ